MPVPVPLVTAIGPLVAPVGTFAVSVVAETTANVGAETPLNVTCVAPVKPEPVTVTVVPTGPDAGLKLVTAGAVATTPWQAALPVPQVEAVWLAGRAAMMAAAEVWQPEAAHADGTSPDAVVWHLLHSCAECVVLEWKASPGPV